MENTYHNEKIANEILPEYVINREKEYPSLKDQFDMQFHDAINGTTTWQDTIQTIKAKYPKSE